MKTIQKMYEHLSWANQRIFQALQNVDNQEAIRLFSHILYVENLWITRLKGLDSSHISIWSEDIDLDGCGELIKEAEENITTFLQNLKESDLDKTVSYRNSEGEKFENSVRELLTHIALHGHYHRGQINTLLRKNGHEPISVDFIMFVR